MAWITSFVRRPTIAPAMRPALVICTLLLAAGRLAAAEDDSPIRFARDIQPILAGKCYQCHGPDVQEGKLRLDQPERAMAAAKSGKDAVVPGKPAESELLRRVTSDDPDERMPLEEAPLSPREVDLLRRWIAGGAEYERHWADVPPARPALPQVNDSSWPRSPLDFFVLARLEGEGLAPSGEADRYLLARRVYLDLIGLPPSVKEVEAFLADGRADAYERLVDRLLASPRFGERWARWWLDLARYADTNGYESDEPRTMWPYRDWVIDALNRDMPFDDFTLHQLAGDLLPRAGQSELIASGFHRNTLINTEGGTKADEFKDAAIKDRVDTTAAVWLAATVTCAQCHNHKYDPYTQREYFALYAIFNNTTDKSVVEESDTLDVFYGDWSEVNRLRAKIEELERLIDPEHPGHAGDQAAWEKEMAAVLSAGEKTGLPAEVDAALRVSPADRTVRQQDVIRRHFRRINPRVAALRKEQEELYAALDAYQAERTVRVMIMKEGNRPQPTHVQKRGNFLDPGELVRPGVPAAFGVPFDAAPADRYALAKWLMKPGHPRTSRVTVNRIWDVIFGRGLVATSEDFGTQGDLPSHPEMLDWLALELVDSGWDIKHLLRTIVTSAAYRQSSRATESLLAADPDNRLLGRGPRFRVEAEMIRDVALTAGGRLSAKIGGPSVFPPQPAAVWESLFIEGGYQSWPESEGADRYRRGVYTFLKRTALHPMLANFDGSDRTLCQVSRKRSNTPTAALNTLNGPVFVEAAAGLAQRMLEHHGTDRERAEHGFRLCATRLPRPAELAAVAGLYETALSHYRGDLDAAHAAIAEGRLDRQIADEPALAAWMIVAGTLLNMDATLSK